VYVLCVASSPIFEINPRETCLESLDYLSYFYYAGTVCIGQKQYAEAMDHFLKVFSAPASILSAVCVHSYKRALLVSLIKDGHALILPKHTSTIMQRFSRQRLPVYSNIVELFEVRAQVVTYSRTMIYTGRLVIGRACQKQ
jgi:hypothetical protein